eukprot:scaffold649449_cov48-Prasinocladus_malaysianus.AAC.1
MASVLELSAGHAAIHVGPDIVQWLHEASRAHLRKTKTKKGQAGTLHGLVASASIMKATPGFSE